MTKTTTPKTPETAELSSRRSFLSAAATTAATAGALLATTSASAQTPQPASDLGTDGTREAFEASLNAPATRKDFTSEGGITGAQIFANLCKDEGLGAMFLCPGNYTISQEIAQVGVPAYGGHYEGAMAHAADGFARASGLIAACSGTEGPGFANMLMAVANAHRANTPLLVLASNVRLASEDSFRGLQFMRQQDQTEGIRKYGKRITTPERVYEYGAYAFRALKTGVPGPVHLDFPADVSDAKFTDKAKLTNYFDQAKYRTESRPAPLAADLRKALDMIAKAQRPVLVAGHGVHIRKGQAALLRAAEKNDLGVTVSGPVHGAFPDEHRLSLTMANDALLSADLVVFVGQYQMPSVGEWTLPPGITTIRVHPEPEDIGRNWPVDLGIVSDEALFLEALADALPRKSRSTWVSEIAAAKKKWMDTRLGYYKLGLDHTTKTGRLHPAVIGKEVHDFLYEGKIDPKQTTAGYGGHTIGGYAGHWLRAHRAAQMITTHYQLGPMGQEIAMMMGVGAAMQQGAGYQAAYKGAPVLSICGDGGVGVSLYELETAVKYRIPQIAVISNNNCWGTHPLSRNQPRGVHLHLFSEGIRHDKIMEGLGGHGEYVHTPEELRAALQRSYDIAVKDRIPSVISCQSHYLFSTSNPYPPGAMFNPEPGVGAVMH